MARTAQMLLLAGFLTSCSPDKVPPPIELFCRDDEQCPDDQRCVAGVCLVEPDLGRLDAEPSDGTAGDAGADLSAPPDTGSADLSDAALVADAEVPDLTVDVDSTPRLDQGSPFDLTSEDGGSGDVGRADGGPQPDATPQPDGATEADGSDSCVPEPERCDGLDNDCDGVVDEQPLDIGEPCGLGTGVCQVEGLTECVEGEVRCSALALPPAVETCNGLDDDCDGETDEEVVELGGLCQVGTGDCESTGVLLCMLGHLLCSTEPGWPRPEVCDWLDNDCDGWTDEPPLSCGCRLGDLRSCGTDHGECRKGTQSCDEQGRWQPCRGGVEPEPERCDGLDNDCDLLVDEEIADCYCTPGTERSCGIALFPCVPGLQQCDPDGQWGPCVGSRGPEEERCDGVDNDCNGAIDEGNPEGGDACGPARGVCRPGILRCEGGLLLCLGASGAPSAELCDGLDNDCDGEIDEGVAELGQPCGVNLGGCRAGVWQCAAGRLVCTGSLGPEAEQCDGADNDCDGEVDEDDPALGEACGSAIGTCRTGTLICGGGSLLCTGGLGPAPEECNQLDDDCNGVVDDAPGGCECLGLRTRSCGQDEGACVAGLQRCQDGRWGPCMGELRPEPEVCDGQDNDCDGQTDEADGPPPPCGREFGQCRAGLQQCRAGILVCEGAVGPAAEVCDGVDNDCDGATDEEVPGAGVPCGSTEGECAAGMFSCVAGRLICQGAAGPQVERCNGLDDDCDGSTDESDAQLGQPCGSAVGECRLGVHECRAGQLVCVGQVRPAPERCDGRDNDCDGALDEEDPALGTACGESTGACEPGAWQCVVGVLTCLGARGPVPERCNGLDDDCDGAADEDWQPLLASACDGPDEDQCPLGTWRCRASQDGLECVGDLPTELCPGVDDDGDRLSNELEPWLGTDPQQRDTDGDGIEDSQEDADHDGVPNLQEVLEQTNPVPILTLAAWQPPLADHIGFSLFFRQEQPEYQPRVVEVFIHFDALDINLDPVEIVIGEALMDAGKELYVQTIAPGVLRIAAAGFTPKTIGSGLLAQVPFAWSAIHDGQVTFTFDTVETNFAPAAANNHITFGTGHPDAPVILQAP